MFGKCKSSCAIIIHNQYFLFMVVCTQLCIFGWTYVKVLYLSSVHWSSYASNFLKFCVLSNVSVAFPALLRLFPLCAWSPPQSLYNYLSSLQLRASSLWCVDVCIFIIWGCIIHFQCYFHWVQLVVMLHFQPYFSSTPCPSSTFRSLDWCIRIQVPHDEQISPENLGW